MFYNKICTYISNIRISCKYLSSWEVKKSNSKTLFETNLYDYWKWVLHCVILLERLHVWSISKHVLMSTKFYNIKRSSIFETPVICNCLYLLPLPFPKTLYKIDWFYFNENKWSKSFTISRKRMFMKDKRVKNIAFFLFLFRDKMHFVQHNESSIKLKRLKSQQRVFRQKHLFIDAIHRV